MPITPAARKATIDGAIRSALVRAGDHIARKLQERLEAKQKNATGSLSQSIVVTMPILTDHGWSVRIGPTAKHAVFVIHGRQPGARMPPISAIENWLMVRGIRIGSKGLSQDQAIKSAAWAIARSIQKEGIKPFPFIATVWRQEGPVVRRMLRQSMHLAIEQLNKGKSTKGRD